MTKKVEKDIFTTERGVHLEILAIAPFEMQEVAQAIQKRFPMPEAPTYTMETVGGGQETKPLTLDTAQSEEEKARYLAYLEQVQAAQSATSLELNDYMLMAGVRIPDDAASDDGWMKRQRRFGVELPEDPDELKLHYLKTVILTGNDFAELLPRIMAKTGVDRGLVDTARESFQRAVVRPDREAGAGTGEGSANGEGA